MRRSVVPVVLLLLWVMVPVGALAPPLLSMDDPFGREVVLVSNSGFTGEDWLVLEQKGVQPLRPLDETRLLVWVPGIDSIGRSVDGVALLIGGHSISDDLQPYEGSVDVGLRQRVLFEPHLPADGMRQALGMLADGGFIVDEGFIARDGGAMPVWVTGIASANDLSDVAGVLWIEPVLKAGSRNDVSASLMENGGIVNHSLWNLGLNGSGLLLAVADSGIDLDHACFREGVGIVGSTGDSHRKIQAINTTVDDWDHSGDTDFGHGTHIAGTLSCEWVTQGDEYPEGLSPSHGARLLVQDIVGDEGWLPPDDAEWLFLEAAQNGAMIHSDSWGDNTAEYTKRSGDFDGWAREVPWSLVFVAPGNTGGQLLEPSNARNVIAVGAVSKSGDVSMLSSSSIGPTDIGSRGIFLVAPGQSIVSAKADGVIDSLNGGTSMKTGTSMATPMAASGAAIIQQLVEDGWVTGGDARDAVNLSLPDGSQLTLMLGEGFTPSGPLMKALLSLSTTSMVNSTHSGGVLGHGPDAVQGWGVLNLSELIDFNEIEASAGSNESVTPGAGIWIVDSYRMDEWSNFTSARGVGTNRPLDVLGQNPWNGSGAAGPFLSSGEEVRWNFSLDKVSPFDVRLSWLAKPAPYPVDDLRLSVILPDGREAHGSDFSDGGWTNLRDGDHVPAAFDNETTTGVSIAVGELVGVEWVHVVVRGKYVSAGSSPGTLGIEGDRVGFGLVVKGIEQNLPVIVQGGSILNISVGGAVGYQFSPEGGGEQEIEIMPESALFEWDFESKPGALLVVLSLAEPRTLSAHLSSSDLGFEDVSGAPIGVMVPRCEPFESVNPFLTDSRQWNWTGVWWPPDISGCRGSSVQFMLDFDDSNPPEALNEWESWRKNITDNERLVAVRVMIDMSEWQHPWEEEGNSGPERAVCEYRFSHEEWSGCDLFVSDWVEVPPEAYSLDIRISWVENGGLVRELIITHHISPFKVNEPSELEFDVLDGVVTIVSGSVPPGGWPVILIRDGDDSAYVELVESEWKISPINCDKSQSSYMLMIAGSFDSADINSFGYGHQQESDILIVDGISLEGNWTYSLIRTQNDFFLLLEEMDRGWDLVVPLVLKDTVVLDNRCVEMDDGFSFLNTVFWMWLILTFAIVIFVFMVRGKKKEDVGMDGADEES